MDWELRDNTGVVRCGLTEQQVRTLVRVNENPDVYGRNTVTGQEIRWEDVQNEPLPPGHEDPPTNRSAASDTRTPPERGTRARP